MSAKSSSHDTFDYHSNPPGKLSVSAKPVTNREELALAYTPGVADVCRAIQQDPAKLPMFTNIHNRVLVISDGTATLGLGNTGHEAVKPVTEGKAVLMKNLAGIDAVDLVCPCEDIYNVVNAIKCNFGAINIEDVAAPRCFELVAHLQQDSGIPIFHDDQDGTAVVILAALLKALQRTNRSLHTCKVVIAGAGAGAQATARLLMAEKLPLHNIFMFDSKGLLTKNRNDLDAHKRCFAHSTDPQHYAEVLKGADVLIGLSRANIIQPEWTQNMNARPIIFALANPIAELNIPEAKAIHPEGIFASGSSEDDNQVNNVLCFPYLLRGALDARAKRITREMLLAFAHALTEIETPHLLPDPFDVRLLSVLPGVVAKTAMRHRGERV